MAVPAYATDLTVITASFTVGWSLFTEGGGGANTLTAPETDDFIQGTQAVSRSPWSTAARGIIHDPGANVTVAADDAVFTWWKADVAQALDTFAGGGIFIAIGTSVTVYKRFYVAGSDTYALGGWRCTPIDPSIASSLDRGAPGAPPYRWHGVGFDVPATGPGKGFPFKCDMIRHGRDVEVTAGEIANPATWDLLADHADEITRRWGIVQGTNTGAIIQGRVYWGTAAALCYCRDANRTITLADTLGFTSTTFTQIIVANASTDLEWSNITIASLDTLNRGVVQVLNNALASFLACAFADINTTADGGTNSTWDASVWRRCNAVTAAGGSFLGCQVLAPTVAANTSGFIYNVATNPDGVLDGMEFTKGAADHHAIEFGLTSPTTMTLRNMTFTGFSGSNNVNGSVLHILRTTGTVTITLVGTATPSYRTAGATVEFVTNPITVSVVTADATGTPVGSCNVFLYATATTGTLPANDSVTIVNAATTATVTHTAHGLSTNDRVWIQDASLAANNGVFQITVTGVDTYTYTMGSSPGSSPTGTITATFVFIFGLSDAVTGLISLTRSIPANQSVAGRSRRSSGAPLYRNGPVTGTVDSTTGAAFTAVMISDE